jgi:RsmE family RNA methyltransferase
MNVVLLSAGEVHEGVVRLTDRRATHLRKVLRVSVGDSVRVGIRDGLLGDGTVVRLEEDSVSLRVNMVDPPPPRADIDVILAIPRPKALKRVISALAQLGANRVLLINAARVERSYFDSKVLNKEFLSEWVAQGLEQAIDTRSPLIEVRTRLKPFVEDELAQWQAPGTELVLPHPVSAAPLRPVAGHVTIAIGPDGGWVPFEVDLFRAHGFQPVSLGPRVLRVEVAVPLTFAAVRRPPGL